MRTALKKALAWLIREAVEDVLAKLDGKKKDKS